MTKDRVQCRQEQLGMKVEYLESKRAANGGIQSWSRRSAQIPR